MRIAISLFITSLLFQVNAFAQDTTIVWKQVNNSRYSFKYPENWKLEFQPNSRDGFLLHITDGSNVKRTIGTIRLNRYNIGVIISDTSIARPKPDSVSDTLSIESIIPLEPQAQLEVSEWRKGQGVKYYYTETLLQTKGTQYRRIRCGWSLGDMSYDLQIPLPEEIANKYKPILNEMIQSFVFMSQ